MSAETPRVESFVLRFVRETAIPEGDAASRWHGIIVHVQTNEEKNFTHLTDALAFIGQYISLETPGEPEANRPTVE